MRRCSKRFLGVLFHQIFIGAYHTGLTAGTCGTLGYGMTPKTTHSLQKHIGRTQTRNQKIRINIQRLLQNLRPDQNSSALRPGGRFFSENIYPSMFVHLAIGHGESGMNNAELDGRP